MYKEGGAPCESVTTAEEFHCHPPRRRSSEGQRQGFAFVVSSGARAYSVGLCRVELTGKVQANVNVRSLGQYMWTCKHVGNLSAIKRRESDVERACLPLGIHLFRSQEVYYLGRTH